MNDILPNSLTKWELDMKNIQIALFYLEKLQTTKKYKGIRKIQQILDISYLMFKSLNNVVRGPLPDDYLNTMKDEFSKIARWFFLYSYDNHKDLCNIEPIFEEIQKNTSLTHEEGVINFASIFFNIGRCSELTYREAYSLYSHIEQFRPFSINSPKETLMTLLEEFLRFCWSIQNFHFYKIEEN